MKRLIDKRTRRSNDGKESERERDDDDEKKLMVYLCLCPGHTNTDACTQRL